MDFTLATEQLDVRDTARAFVTGELLPLEASYLRSAQDGAVRLPREEERRLQESARAVGLWGLNTPAEYGGRSLPAVTQSLAHTEIAKSCVPFRFGGEAHNILLAGTAEQRAAYLVPTIAGERTGCFALTEPGAGSDAAGISATARQDGDDWLISGQKMFISDSRDADYAIVIAVTDPDTGARHGSSAFLVDRADGWTATPIPTMGSWHQPALLTFDDVRVPSSRVLGEAGAGFDLAMRWVARGRHVIPAQCVGIAERCLAMAVEWADRRETFGRKLGTNQAIQWMIADSETELEAARWLALRAAWAHDHGGDVRHAAAMAKLYATGMVGRVVDRALQIHGGRGYTKDLPIEGWYRAVRAMRIFEGTDEVQRLILARDLLRGFTQIGGLVA